MRSSPIAATGALLAMLSVVALASRHRAEHPPSAPEPVVGVAPDSAPAAPIDVNLADAHQLEELPRIGPALAARIVAHRDAHGPFETLDSLARVPGIGPRTVEALRPYATVGAATREHTDSAPR